jgi:hypothetical protein
LQEQNLSENVCSVLKGPLSAEKIERLRQKFNRLAEPIGN